MTDEQIEHMVDAMFSVMSRSQLERLWIALHQCASNRRTVKSSVWTRFAHGDA